MKKQIIFDYYKTIYNPNTKSLYRGVVSLLKNLSKNFRLILITTYETGRKEQISKFGLQKRFEVVKICNKKTTKTFKRFTEESPSTLIIGDRDEEELKIAKILKCQSIKIAAEKENPCRTINKYLERNKYGST